MFSLQLKEPSICRPGIISSADRSTVLDWRCSPPTNEVTIPPFLSNDCAPRACDFGSGNQKRWVGTDGQGLAGKLTCAAATCPHISWPEGFANSPIALQMLASDHHDRLVLPRCRYSVKESCKEYLVPPFLWHPVGHLLLFVGRGGIREGKGKVQRRKRNLCGILQWKCAWAEAVRSLFGQW